MCASRMKLSNINAFLSEWKADSNDTSILKPICESTWYISTPGENLKEESTKQLHFFEAELQAYIDSLLTIWEDHSLCDRGMCLNILI